MSDQVTYDLTSAPESETKFRRILTTHDPRSTVTVDLFESIVQPTKKRLPVRSAPESGGSRTPAATAPTPNSTSTAGGNAPATGAAENVNNGESQFPTNEPSKPPVEHSRCYKSLGDVNFESLRDRTWPGSHISLTVHVDAANDMWNALEEIDWQTFRERLDHLIEVRTATETADSRAYIGPEEPLWARANATVHGIPASHRPADVVELEQRAAQTRKEKSNETLTDALACTKKRKVSKSDEMIPTEPTSNGECARETTNVYTDNNGDNNDNNNNSNKENTFFEPTLAPIQLPYSRPSTEWVLERDSATARASVTIEQMMDLADEFALKRSSANVFRHTQVLFESPLLDEIEMLETMWKAREAIERAGRWGAMSNVFLLASRRQMMFEFTPHGVSDATLLKFNAEEGPRLHLEPLLDTFEQQLSAGGLHRGDSQSVFSRFDFVPRALAESFSRRTDVGSPLCENAHKRNKERSQIERPKKENLQTFNGFSSPNAEMNNKSSGGTDNDVNNNNHNGRLYTNALESVI